MLHFTSSEGRDEIISKKSSSLKPVMCSSLRIFKLDSSGKWQMKLSMLFEMSHWMER